jgi:hypothetical protein
VDEAEMSAAHLEARRTAGLSTSDPTHACSGAISSAKPDCGEKRDPDTQSEKPSFDELRTKGSTAQKTGYLETPFPVFLGVAAVAALESKYTEAQAPQYTCLTLEGLALLLEAKKFLSVSGLKFADRFLIDL